MMFSKHLSSIICPFDGLNDIKIEDVFVEPLISNQSTFSKDYKAKEYFKLGDILSKNENVVFYSRKEYGKTSLLRYVESEMLRNEEVFEGKLPVFIQFINLPKNNPDSIRRIVRTTLDGNITEEVTTNYLESGRFVILIDDFDDYNDDDREKRKKELFNIIDKYPKCRYILSANENLSQSFKEESIKLANSINASRFYLCSFNTARIRQLLEKWCHYEDFDVDGMLNHIVFYFQQLRIPVTPMAVTLFIGVLIRDRAKKNLRNEAYLIENYLETILEKLGKGSFHGQMDFRDKESFLANVAYKMYVKGEFELTKAEFERDKIDYFETYDEDLPNERIFEDFYKKGILQESSEAPRPQGGASR